MEKLLEALLKFTFLREFTIDKIVNNAEYCETRFRACDGCVEIGVKKTTISDKGNYRSTTNYSHIKTVTEAEQLKKVLDLFIAENKEGTFNAFGHDETPVLEFVDYPENKTYKLKKLDVKHLIHKTILEGKLSK